jgi:PAS domain S-box-containing protein
MNDLKAPFIATDGRTRLWSVGRQLISFAGVFVAGLASFSLPIFGAQYALPILPSGIAVAASRRWGIRIWPSIFRGGVAIDLSNRQPLTASICVGIGLAASTVLCTWLLERCRFDATFVRTKDVPLFMLIAAVGMTLAPTFGMLGFRLVGAPFTASDLVQWIRWWANSTLGVLLVSPIFMGDRRDYLLRFREQRKIAALWFGGILACCIGMLVGNPLIGRPLTVVMAVFVTVLGTMRFGLAIAALGTLAICALAGLSLSFDVGVFAQLPALPAHVTLWALGAALTGLNFITAALLAERDSAARHRLLAERRYAHVFDGSPQPMWVYDQESRRFLLVNAATVRQYGWTQEEFLSSRVDLLAPADEPRVVPEREDRLAEGFPEPFETRHCTSQGRVLDVEVWTRTIEFEDRPAELAFAVDVTERRAFGQALMEAVAAEQRRIGQEMHDGLGQELTGLSLSLRALANVAHRERDVIAADIDDLARLATTCIAETQRIVLGLSPLSEDDDSLDSALEELAKRSSLSGVGVRFIGHHQGSLVREPKVRHHLYRIAQEALQNALKHSGAKLIEIELFADDGRIRLSISDDGHGFANTSSLGLGLGMRTMRFRASAVGGKLTINQESGRNYVICEVRRRPWAAEPAPEKPQPAFPNGR